MHHTSNLKFSDLIIGTYISYISRRFNQIINAIFALIFTYQSLGLIHADYNIFEIVAWLIIYIIFLLLIYIFMFFISIFITLVTPKLNKGVLGKHEFNFFSDEFVEKTTFNEEHLKYSTIDNVFVRFGRVYIQISGLKLHILPKRDFKTKEDKYELVEFLRDKLKHANASK